MQKVTSSFCVSWPLSNVIRYWHGIGYQITAILCPSVMLRFKFNFHFVSVSLCFCFLQMKQLLHPYLLKRRLFITLLHPKWKARTSWFLCFKPIRKDQLPLWSQNYMSIQYPASCPWVSLYFLLAAGCWLLADVVCALGLCGWLRWRHFPQPSIQPYAYGSLAQSLSEDTCVMSSYLMLYLYWTSWNFSYRHF